ncbi:hypothetical protein VitviT2T_029234 [Vitis vinifera]|uniref:Alpha/beta hydrolase fold-3 domain-containing protein n=2 Tax=Vitis vinifera TaxID=29760 RepID=A0ABY9DVN0_VITVI|nr:probable carboxylesterase 18 [Vitis vinifera]RVW74973.1 putative carboxylesterase 18 [Vitis vinifera]WKA11765.1 hypothetical protein VitviT2T_029234 [Vitis vinifera]|eukprot:XP_002268654.1 PREDICTED: probable carboxylesterase 18 [Vitis vinifera]
MAGSEVRTSPELPLKLRLSLAIFSAVSKVSLRRNGTVNRCLMSLVDFKSSTNKKPIKGVTTSDTTVDSSRNIWFRAYRPREAASGENLPMIVYFHGGGFALLAANSKPYNDLCLRLSRKLPAIVVSVNYRLSPDHRYPSQYDDGFDALKFLDDNPPANADLTRCFIAGDSAGGNLAHHVTARAGEFEFRNLKILGVIPIQPFFGGEERTESETQLARAPVLSMKLTDWYWRAFLPEGSDRDHAAANVFGPKSSGISGVKFPKSLVFIGGFDPLKEWQKRYCEGLKMSGNEVKVVEYGNGIHGFYVFPELPESGLMVEEVREFMKERTGFGDQ